MIDNEWWIRPVSNEEDEARKGENCVVLATQDLGDRIWS